MKKLFAIAFALFILSFLFLVFTFISATNVKGAGYNDAVLEGASSWDRSQDNTRDWVGCTADCHWESIDACVDNVCITVEGLYCKTIIDNQCVDKLVKLRK